MTILVRNTLLILSLSTLAVSLSSCTNLDKEEEVETQQAAEVFEGETFEEDEGLYEDDLDMYEEEQGLGQGQGIGEAPLEGDSEILGDARAEPLETPTLTGVALATQEDPVYGKYLADELGNPLYIYTADQQQDSTCYGGCAQVWIPVTTTGPVAAVANDLDTALLGTVDRLTGERQVTYNQWPLYYYAHDQGTEQATGHGKQTGTATWYLIAPTGEPITRDQNSSGNTGMEESQDIESGQATEISPAGEGGSN